MTVLRRRWAVVVLITVLAVLGSVAGILVAGPSYVASSTLQVASGVSSNGQLDALEYTDRLINTYKEIAESASLQAELERSLGSGGDIRLSVEPLPNTELIELTASADDAGVAQRAANLGATALVQRVRARAEEGQRRGRERVAAQLAEIEQGLAKLRGQLASATDGAQRRRLREQIGVRELSYQALVQQSAALDAARETRTLSISDPASRPGALAREELARALALGLLSGLAVGAGVAFLLERRHPQLDTLEDIERAAGTTILATVPPAGAALQPAFSNLRARLLSLVSDLPRTPRTVLITSAGEGDGKSLLAANLASSLARARHPSILIDGDLRDPSLHRWFGLDNDRGLGDLLRLEEHAAVRLSSVVSMTEVPGLSVLTSGPPLALGTELLSSPRMAQVISSEAGRNGSVSEYEFVVVDSPALATGSDAAAIAAHVDVVILVVGPPPMSGEAIKDARGQLEGSGARLVVVVNCWRGERFSADRRPV